MNLERNNSLVILLLVFLLAICIDYYSFHQKTFAQEKKELNDLAGAYATGKSASQAADSLIKSMPGGYISMIESVMNTTGNNHVKTSLPSNNITSLSHNPIIHSK
jgi:hypothetical protein